MPNPTIAAQIQALRERNPLWCMREICQILDQLNEASGGAKSSKVQNKTDRELFKASRPANLSGY